MRFLVNGSVAYDLLLTHDGSFVDALDPKHLDRLSVNYLAHGFARHHGGTATNIAWNLALLGEKPSIVSAVGTDGTEFVKMLKDRGVDVSMIESKQEAVTAMAVIATDSGERQISFFHPGADAFGSFPDVTEDRDELAFAIMSPRNPMLMLKGAQECARLKIPYVFDPGQVVHAFGQSDFRLAVEGSAGLIVNEYEWQLASDKLGWDEAEVVSQCGMLIVTLGDKGLRIVTPKERVEVKACPPEKLINPTGAGDAARAGLLLGLARQWPLKSAAELGAIMGSLVCEQAGTLLDSLDLDEVNAKALATYGAKLPF